MRRLKAIYLVPVALVLLIGAGFAFYYFLLKPQMELTTKSQQTWLDARKAMKGAQAGYATSLQDQVTYSKTLYMDYYLFHHIQNRMPAILDMKEVYTGKEREGMVRMYKIMGQGEWIRELTRWSNSFHLPKSPKFEFSGTMGYEDSLSDIKMIGIDFGDKEFFALGYQALLQKVARTTGYGYFPLIFNGPGGATGFKITVDRTNPRHRPNTPALTMGYSVKGYFMTRGWDPLGAGAKDQVAKAVTTITNPPQEEKKRDEVAAVAQCPTVLWIFKPTLPTD